MLYTHYRVTGNLRLYARVCVCVCIVRARSRYNFLYGRGDTTVITAIPPGPQCLFVRLPGPRESPRFCVPLRWWGEPPVFNVNICSRSRPSDAS